MNYFIIIIPFIISILSLLLGWFVFAKHPKRTLHILFMLFCTSFSVVSYVDYAFRIAESYQVAAFWLNFAILVVLPPCFLFHFSLVFSGTNEIIRNKLLYIVLYGINIGYIIFGIFTTSVDTKPAKTVYGWTYGNVEFQWLANIFFIEMMILIIFSIFFFLKAYFREKDETKAQQAKLVIIGIIFALFSYLLFDYLLIHFLPYGFHELGSLSFLFVIIFLGYGMRKYRLFSLDLYSRAREIIENLSDFLILINPNGNITSMNDMTLNLFKFSEKELLGQNIRNLLFSEEDIKIFDFQLQLLLKFRKKDVVNDIEMDFKCRKASKVPVSLSASKIRDDLGNIKGLILIGREISERKRMEQELHDVLDKQKLYIDEILKSSTFKSEFMSSLSHELRTPLNSIIGFTDLLIEQSYGELNENQLEFLEDIKYSSNHLLRLIDQLLDISKMEAHKLELDSEKIKLVDLIQEISSSIMPLYKKKGLEFFIEGSLEEKKIFADYSKLKQIFLNLLSNAIKFTPDGKIGIKIEENERFWVFHIIDTGIGIPDKEFDNVFREFIRIKHKNIKNEQGTGLGLPLTKRMIEMHGGEIWFESQLDKGSTFSFNIPKNS